MKRIVTVFYTSHADTVGNANRISRIKLLEDNYSLVILTNKSEFVGKLFKKSKIIGFSNLGNSFVNRLSFWLLAGSKLFSLRFDCLFMVFSDSPIAFFKKGRPCLCHIHQSHGIIGIGENKSKGIKGKIKKLIFNINAGLLIKGVKKADYSFAVSPQLKDFFIEKGVNQKKIEYLPHGVDISIFNNNAKRSKLLDRISSEMFIMTYTGWVGEKRGLHLMLDGLSLIKKHYKNIHLVIVGASESYIKFINDYAANNKLNNSISVFGRIDYTEIPNILKETDICLSFLEVNASYSMSPPQKIFEYFTMGKPVIANKIPTHTDYITDNYNGRIIDNLEPEQFKKVILELVNDRKRVTEMGENAFKYSQKYNMKFVKKRLISKINELLLN